MQVGVLTVKQCKTLKAAKVGRAVARAIKGNQYHDVKKAGDMAVMRRGTRIQAKTRRRFENWSVPAHSAGNGGAGHDLEESFMESIVYDFILRKQSRKWGAF